MYIPNPKMKKYCFIVCVILCVSCHNSPDSTPDSKQATSQLYGEEDNNVEDDAVKDTAEDEQSSCGIADGSHTAMVDYTNDGTGYSQTYTLDVEVEDCQVTQINFPNGGWLDADHITPAEIDTDGNASVDGEDGKSYEVHIAD